MTIKSIEHYLAERSEVKNIYNEHDSAHMAIKEKIERRAELIDGIQRASAGLKKLRNPAFNDQICLSMPSFRFGVSAELFKTELNRQLEAAKDELEKIDALIAAVGELLSNDRES